MQVQFTLYTLPLLVTTALTGASAWLLWKKGVREDVTLETVSANHTQLLVLVLLTLWIGGSLVTVSTDSLQVVVFGLLLTVLAGTWTAVGWFYFVLLYTGRRHLVTPLSVGALTLGAITATVGVATNGLHQLVVSDLKPDASLSSTFLTVEWGIGIWAIAAFNVTLSMTAVWLLSKKFVSSRNVYRKIAFVHIVAGLILNWGPIISFSNKSPVPYLLLGSLAFFGVAVVSVPAIISYRYLSLIPLEKLLSATSKLLSMFGAEMRNLEPMARDVIIQNMQSGVIVTDHHNRIVDLNPRGRRMTGTGERRIVGEKLTDVIDPDLIQADDVSFLFPGTTGTFRGIWVETPEGEQRCYDIMVNSIGEDTGESSGRVALINDVTDRERRKEKLKQRTQEFDLLRQVQSRILRHNIRNDLTMIRGGVEQLTEQVDENPHATGIIEATDDLMSISEKVQLVEDVIDTDAETTECDLRELVEGMAERIETQYPGIDIELQGASACRIQVITRLEVAIENILENAVEHNDSADPHVTVRIADGPAPSLTITDNGPGIPDQEVAVLEHEEETSLEHGSSIGLWLIKWIVDRSDAQLEFETSAEGTEVTLQFTEEQRVTDTPRPAASTHR